jgi:hypothetical protein
MLEQLEQERPSIDHSEMDILPPDDLTEAGESLTVAPKGTGSWHHTATSLPGVSGD